MSNPDPNTPIKGRGASWNPQNRFERIEYVHDEDAHERRRAVAAAAHDFSARSDAHHPRAQRQPRRRLRHQHQSLPRLRARLHLLLRAPVARIPRLLRRPRLRDEDPGEGRRAGAAARGADVEEVQAAHDRHQRRHRSLPADRAEAAAHAALPAGAGGVPQSGRHHHQEPSRHARHRRAAGAGRAQRGVGAHLRDHARSAPRRI